jgi:nitroreductase
LKEKIKPLALNQRQITECSDLLVFAAWDDYTAERINMMFDLVNSERALINEGWENYRRVLLKTYVGRDKEFNFNHAAKQAYIGLGVAMVAAPEEQIDCTPMEGFDPKALDDLLGLKELGLRSTVLLALGNRASENDWLVNLKKVRRPFESFVRNMK